MEMEESIGIRLRGCLEIHIRDAKTNEILRKIRNPNAPALAGVAWMLQHMLSGEGATSQTLQQVALGTDTTAPTTADSALGSELARKVVGTWETSGLTATDGPFFAAQADFGTAEANGTLAEAGLFNSSAAGTMLVHATFATQEKATSNTLGITYTVTGNIT